jgi:hypothetical protein
MTPPEIVTIASETMQALSQAASGRVFMKSITKFIDALSCVPDYSHAAFSSEEVARLQHATVQLELARAIYELRRELEEISRWRRHYLG